MALPFFAIGMKLPCTNKLASNLILFIYFWLCYVFIAKHGLFLVAWSGGYFLIVVSRLLIGVASLVGEDRL